MTAGAFDATFVLYIVAMLSVGVLAIIVGFGFLGYQAYKKGEGTEYFRLLLGGEVLRMLTVGGVTVVVLMLAFAKIIEGNVVGSILSAIIGFVLGGKLPSERQGPRPVQE